MGTYLKIERAAGGVLALEDKDDPIRVLDKEAVWIPLTVQAVPDFDSAAEKLVARLDIPDLADMSRDVAPDAVATEGFDVVALTAEEIALREQNRVDDAVLAAAPLLDVLKDGSFVPDQNYTADQIETKIKAQL